MFPFRLSNKVRAERLELSHLAALDPKSSVSTNSTTPALLLWMQIYTIQRYFKGVLNFFLIFEKQIFPPYEKQKRIP